MLATMAAVRGSSFSPGPVKTGFGMRCSRRRFNSETARRAKSAAEMATSYLKARFIHVGNEGSTAHVSRHRDHGLSNASVTNLADGAACRLPQTANGAGGVVAWPHNRHFLTRRDSGGVPLSFYWIDH